VPPAPGIEGPVTGGSVVEEPPGFFDFTTRAPLIQAALGLDFASASSQGKAFRIFQYIVQFFLVVGFIRLIFAPRKLRFTTEFIALTAGSALLLFASIFLPGFADQMNATRFYHIALILLAPLCILGGESIWLGVRAQWHKAGTVSLTEDNQVYLRFVTLAVLIPYFLLTSGFIFEATRHEVIDRIDTPYSIALSSHRVDIGGVFNRQDGAGADWLRQRFDDEDTIYADLYGWLVIGYETHLDAPMLLGYEVGPLGQVFNFPWDMSQVPWDTHIFLRARNIERQEITYHARIAGCRKSVSFSEAGVDDLIQSRNRIYNNGGAQVLAPRRD